MVTLSQLRAQNRHRRASRTHTRAQMRSKILPRRATCWFLLSVPVRQIHARRTCAIFASEERFSASRLPRLVAIMDVLKRFNGKFNLLGRISLTLAVGTAGDRQPLSGVGHCQGRRRHQPDGRHAGGVVAVRRRRTRVDPALMATPGSSADAALVGFEKAVERRIARLRALNELVEKRAGAYGWTEAVGTNVDVQQLEQERRAYVTAGAAAPSTGSEESAMGLHLFDLRAKKLMVTVSAHARPRRDGEDAGARRGAGDHDAVVGIRRPPDRVSDLVPGVEPEAAARAPVEARRPARNGPAEAGHYIRYILVGFARGARSRVTARCKLFPASGPRHLPASSSIGRELSTTDNLEAPYARRHSPPHAGGPDGAADRRGRAGQHRHRQRRRQRRIEGRPSGRDGDRHRPGNRPQVRRASATSAAPTRSSVPPGTYQVQAELAGFGTAEVPKVELLVGQNASIAFALKISSLAETLTVTRRSAARRSHVDAGGRQRRSPPDGGDAAAGPQLARAVDARQGHHREQRHQLAGRRPERVVQPQPRRPADQAERAVGRQRRTAVQPRGDRRIPDRHQPVRHHPGPIDRRAGAGDLEVGHQQPVRRRLRLLPRRQVQRGRPGRADRCCRTRTSRPASRSAARSSRTASTTSSPTSTRTIRRPCSRSRRSSAARASRSSSPTKQNSYLARGDLQISPRDTLSMRASQWRLDESVLAVAARPIPSLASILSPRSTNAAATWSRVFTNNRVGQLLVGYNHFLSSTMPQPGVFGQPQYDFPGATMGAPFNYPSIEGTDTYQFRYSQTWTHDKHEFKFGGEYLNAHDSGTAYYSAFGRMTFLSLPSPAEMARRFPIDQWNNPAAWDLNGLDAIVQRFDLNSDAGSGDIPPWNYDVPRPTYALWFGDVWRLNPKLTVNYGLRWDDDWGAAAPPGITENSIPIDNRLRERRLRVRAGHLRPQELRAARRLQLQRRRQERLRDPRRDRPLLRDAGVERHLQPAAVQPLHLLDLQQRRQAGLRHRSDARRHVRRHPDRQGPAPAADDANPVAGLQDAVHVAIQRRLPEAARLGDGD